MRAATRPGVAMCGGVHARISDRIEPMPQLGVQIVEIAERAGEEEVLADIPIRPLDLASGLGPVRAAGLGLEAVMPGKIDERAIVNAATFFADHCRLHAVVEDLLGNAADRLEGCHVIAQDRLHVLVEDEPGPNQPAMAEHEGEEPRRPRLTAADEMN